MVRKKAILAQQISFCVSAVPYQAMPWLPLFALMCYPQPSVVVVVVVFVVERCSESIMSSLPVVIGSSVIPPNLFFLLVLIRVSQALSLFFVHGSLGSLCRDLVARGLGSLRKTS